MNKKENRIEVSMHRTCILHVGLVWMHMYLP
jgi:hypothetical protein